MLKYFVIFLLFLELLSAEFLEGRVIVLGERYGKENLSIGVLYKGIEDITIKNGNFKLNLGKEYHPGDTVALTIYNPNWHIHSPSNGRFILPKNYYIEVEVVESIKNRQNKKVKFCVQISSFKFKSSADKLRDEFNDNWKDKYEAYTKKIDGTHKVLITVNPYSKSNIEKLYQDIKKSRYEKSQPFIRKNCK